MTLFCTVSAPLRLSSGHYALRASVVVLVFTGARRPLLIKSSILAINKKPQNFQHHKNGRQEIAACNAQWAIPGL